MADPRTDESRTDGAHRRSGLTWLVAAAAVVLIAAGVGLALAQGDDDDPPVAGGASSTSSTSPSSGAPGEEPTLTTTTLTLDGAASSGRCLPPLDSPQVVASQSLALEGTVTAISGDKVTLEPGRFYTGEETDLVTVTAPDDDLAALLSAVTFEEGGRYLVSATDDRVTLCGFTAEYSDELAAVYAEAFPG